MDRVFLITGASTGIGAATARHAAEAGYRCVLAARSIDKLEAHAAAIPTGTIFVVVREDSPYRVTRMTHLGFVVQKRHGTFLRHASSAPSHRVVDEPLDHFLTRNARYPWKVDGVSLFEVVSRKNAIAHVTP